MAVNLKDLKIKKDAPSIFQQANQNLEQVATDGLKIGMQGLQWVGDRMEDIDKSVNLRNIAGIPSEQDYKSAGMAPPPEPKWQSDILDYSVHDARGHLAGGVGNVASAGSKLLGADPQTSEKINDAAEFLAQIIIPQTADLALGAGYYKRILSKSPELARLAIKAGDSMNTKAWQHVVDLINPQSQLAIAGIPGATSRSITDIAKVGNISPTVLKINKETAAVGGGLATRTAKTAAVSNRAAGVDIAHDYYLRNLKGDDLARYTELAGSKSRAADYRTVESLTEAMIKQGLSPHHMDEAAQFAKTMAGRTDTDNLMRGLNNLDIFPGNHPRNFMGMYNDNTAAIQQSLTVQLHQLLGGDKTLREIKDFLKNTKFKDVIKGTELDPKLLADKPDWVIKGMLSQLDPSAARNWKGFFKGTKLDGQGLGYLKGRINLPKGLFSSEHNQMHKKIINKLPSTLDIENLIKSGKWQTLSTDDTLRYLAKNQLHKQNVAMNVNSLRLKQIQKAMGTTNGDPNDWTDVIAYMAKNPLKSSMSGWYKRVSKGGDDIYKQLGLSQQDLIRDLDPKQAELVAKVFGMEQVPQTTGKIRAFLSKTGLQQKLKIGN